MKVVIRKRIVDPFIGKMDVSNGRFVSRAWLLRKWMSGMSECEGDQQDFYERDVVDIGLKSADHRVLPINNWQIPS